MRVLLDHCVPRPFGAMLTGHEVSTSREQQWERLVNGELLRAAAAAGFDVMITVDRSMPDQQGAGSLPLCVVVLLAQSNRIEDLEPMIPRVLEVLRKPVTPEFIVVRQGE